MLNILILEDHPMMVESIRASLQGTSFKIKVFVANSLRDLSVNSRLLAMARPDLIVSDLNVPDSQGFATIRYLHERYPEVPLLVFSQNDDPVMERQLLAGRAVAFVNKSRHPKIFLKKIQDMLSIIHERTPAGVDSQLQHNEFALVDAHFAQLTPQQNKVLIGLANGLSTAKIAEHLDVGEQTVRAHFSEIYLRLGVKSRSQAVVLYLEWLSHHAQ